MKQESNVVTPRRHTAIYGLQISLFWIVSFLCLINSMHYPLLSIISQVIAIYSVFYSIRLISNHSQNVESLNLGQKFVFGWSSTMYASLLTTFVQYLYIRYIDKGQIFNTLLDFYKDPINKEFIESQFKGFRVEDIEEIILKISYADIAMQFLIFNLIIAIVFTIFIVLFSKTRKTDTGYKQN